MPSGRAVSGPDQGGCQQASVAQYGPPFNELLTVLSLNRSDILPFISGISEGLRTVPSFAFLYLGEMYISLVLTVVCLLLYGVCDAFSCLMHICFDKHIDSLGL